MDIVFGRKKGRPRQSSVTARDLSEHSIPYDKLAPASLVPMPVGTVSQGLRGTQSIPVISAPLTNPTLTHNGTEMNYSHFTAYQRSKLERDRANISRPDSSVSAADSSTLYNDSVASFTTGKRPKTPTHKLRRSEASGSSGRRSPSGADFGSIPLPSSPAVSHSSLRPGSSMPFSSEAERTSRFSTSDTHSSHLSHFFHKPHSNQEEFVFPRPERDEDIEALFEHVSATRDLPTVHTLTIEQKWQLVYGAEQLRWQEEKIREEQARKQGDSSAAGSLGEGTPDWYIRKFLDNTITAKQASSVWVSLKSHETRWEVSLCSVIVDNFGLFSWLERFIELQGASVLAQALMHISRKGAKR
jgi:cytokinesis protein